MTNTMTMMNPAPLQLSAPASRQGRPTMRRSRRAAARRRRRRAALIGTLLDGLATMALAACFVLCAVMMVCAA